MTPLTFHVEQFSDAIAEAKPLLLRHWDELALNKDKIMLAPNWKRYAELQDAGALSVVVARENGRMVGYSCMIVSPGLHYSTCLEARMDIFWLAPEVRGRMGGMRLLTAAERELKRRGVYRVYLGSKLHKDVARLYRALHYTPIEEWWSKLLED